MRKLFIFLIFPVLMIAGNSCKKKEAEPSVKELLTGPLWEYYEMEEYDSNGHLISATAYDNKVEITPHHHIYFYNSMGILIIYFNYELKEDTEPEKLILIDRGGYRSEFEIIKINRTEMILKYVNNTGYLLLKHRR